MTSKPGLTEFGLAGPTDLAVQQVLRLVREKLVGSTIDGVSFMDELLTLVQQVSEVRCWPAGDGGLHFEVPRHEPFEVDLDANRGKLRMLCARLAVLCQESGHDFMPYGGEGTIRRTGKAANGNASESTTWKAWWTNRPGNPEFAIQYQPE